MQSAYIARQAIFDNKSNTYGYELLFRDSPENSFPSIDGDVATSKLILQNHILGDIQALSMNKPAFINFTEHSLVNKFPLMFDKNSIVIELTGQQNPTKGLLKIVQFYHDKGYKIALTEYDVADHWQALFPYLAMIKVDIEKINPKRLLPLRTQLKPFNIKLVAEKVETRFQRQALAEIGFNYFQGFFYAEPEIIEGQILAPIKTQMLNLISETFKSPLDFSAISTIISQDVNLSLGLLKMVNNVATGTRVEVTSLKQAAAYLGEDKLRQFVSILALSKLSSEDSDEISKQALITARMMSSLAKSNPFREIYEYSFITGLLSSMEVILSMSMADILKTMPLAAPIEQALVERTGLLGELLQLTSDFITGRGSDIGERIAKYQLSTEGLQQEFVAATNWYANLLK